MPGLVSWWSAGHLPARSLALDVALAGVAVYAAVLLTSEAVGTSDQPDAAAAAYTVAVLHGTSVVLRRRSPWLAMAGLGTTATVYALVLGLPVFLLGPAVLFVAYGAGLQLPRNRSLVLVAIGIAWLVLLLRLGPGFPGWDSVVLFCALTLAAWFLGGGVRRLQLLVRENAERAAELEQARLVLARHAVAAERLRIARELHDVVAHSMSVIAMHAGAARLAVGTDPASERATLSLIEQTSRNALAEMRRLVTVLRDDGTDGEAGLAALGPAPGLAQLHELVAAVVDAGVTLDVHTSGDLDDVPPGVSLAAYRVAQEALTNVVRHAGPTRARLAVSAADGTVEVQVEDDGTLPGTERVPAPKGGHGTVGMRERVELYGGSMTSAPTPAGGWRVDARIPYAAGVP